MKVRKYATALSVFLQIVLCTCANGQSFDDFRQKARSGFEGYRSRTDAQFADVLRRSWKMVGGGTVHANPLHSTPEIPPLTAPKDSRPQDLTLQGSVSNVKAPSGIQAGLSVPKAGTGESSGRRLTFSLYGINCSASAPTGPALKIRSGNEESVATAWKELSSGAYDAFLADLGEIYRRLKLCDWAYLRLTEAASAALFGSPERDEAVLLQAWALSRSGLKVRLCRDGGGRLQKLLSADAMLFDVPYYSIGGESFFLCGEPATEIAVQAETFPGTRPMHMPISTAPLFSGAQSKKKTLDGAGISASVPVNEAARAFYRDYPVFCDEGNPVSSFAYIAQASLSEGAIDALYRPLRDRLRGCGETEAVDILLKFVQQAFPYREDEKVWGQERYFYPEETLCYPYSDCEDRAILFTRLVRDLTGLRTALVYYPGHLSAAVCFSSDVPGCGYTADGRKYTVCDPSYMGAGIGELMPGMNSEEAVLVLL